MEDPGYRHPLAMIAMGSFRGWVSAILASIVGLLKGWKNESGNYQYGGQSSYFKGDRYVTIAKVNILGMLSQLSKDELLPA